MRKPVHYIADHLRQVLKNGASAPHTAEVEHFFKNVVASRGWYTAELREVARRFTKVIKGDQGLNYLVAVADDLFHGKILEEKVLAVLLLETSIDEFTAEHFELFESWLKRISSWADHDALASDLLGPMIEADHTLAERVFLWAKSKDRWHRRAAAVSLIRGVRMGNFRSEVIRVTNVLRDDQDKMVQKGLGWLLRESAKHNREFALPFLMRMRARLPRLVLRTACETLPGKDKARVMAAPVKRAAKPAKTATSATRRRG